MIETKLIKRELLTDKSYISLSFSLLIFSFFIAIDLPEAIRFNMTAIEYTLYRMADHYYIIFGYLFMSMIFISSNIKNVSDIELIRISTKNQHKAIKLIAMAIKFAVFIFLHIILCIVISSLFLSLEPTFKGYTFDDLGIGLYNMVGNPVAGLALVSIYLWLGSLFLYQILDYSYHKLNSAGYVATNVLILLSTMVGLQFALSNPSILGIFCFNYYLIFHHIYSPYTFEGLYEILLAIMLITPSVTILRGINIRLSKNYLSLGIVALVFINSYINNYSTLDYLFMNFKGFSRNNFHLVEFLLFMSVYFIPMFIISSLWEEEKQSKNELVKFRYGSTANWKKVFNRRLKIFLVKYSLIYLALILGGGLLYWVFNFDASSTLVSYVGEAYGTSYVAWGMVLGAVIIIKPLELCGMYLVNKSVYSLTKNTIVAFLVTFLLPIGMSSLYQILEFMYLR